MSSKHFYLYALVAIAVSAPGATLCVNPGGTSGCFAHINDAIGSASVSSTIKIAPGVYKEAVTITKSLSLAGESGAIVDATGLSGWLLLALATTGPLLGQASMRPCPPVSERTDEPAPACFTAKQDLGKLPKQPIFWHLFRYATWTSAEEAKGPRGSVVESFGQVWLFTIAEAGWAPSGGEFVAKVGPLPVRPDIQYEAVYMQAVFTPGMEAPLHMHSGPEAFYALTGETPDGVQFGRGPGHVNIVPAGPPMLLVAVGKEKRRGLTLILHDSSQPATTMVHDWQPKGLCKK